ncbi:MAG: type II secretion system inner membrane protein GspF [Chromatiales bacterium]|jgi:general secretion pathway protein F
MSAFEYRVVDQQGRQSRGIIEADTPRTARQRLRENGFIPVSINNIAADKASRKQTSHAQKISGRELSLLTRQMAVLLKSGLPLAEVLNLLSRQTDSKNIQKIMLKLRSAVLEGISLSDAIAQLGNSFPALYRATIAAGESSGKLVEVFESLADYLEQKADIHQKIKLSLLYPVLLTLVSIAVIVSLLIFVIPEIVNVFDSIGQELPLLTVGLLNLSSFLQHNISLLLLIGLALVAATRLLLRIPAVQARYHELVLRLPLFGHMSTISNTALFTRTLAILSKSEVETIYALKIASQVVHNLGMRKAVEQAVQMVREGSSLSQALHSGGYFPDLTIHLISSGEASGNLAEMLDSTASYHEREIQSLTATLVGLFEPLIILLMGGVVLVIVMAILLPIFELNQLVS